MLTYREAACAVLRLYESNEAVAEQLPEPAEAVTAANAALDAARALREAILGSETKIVKADRMLPGESYSGTAYYVSNNGNDKNDGNSPETAWATLDKVNHTQLAVGDAVFFERGGMWRSASLVTQKSVTYSAYGTGAKPRLVGSPENGSDTEKWTLWHEGANGEKIWLYYTDMLDCGAIVMDEGKAVADKMLGFWNGKEFLEYMNPFKGGWDKFDAEVQLAKPVFDPKTQLKVDLTFFSQADSSLPDTLPVFLMGFQTNEKLISVSKGPLYLRCDTGNPGELYRSIEFLTGSDVIDGLQQSCVIDNLFVGYAGGGIHGGQDSSNDNTTVQNCETAWIGGIIASYALDDGMARMAGIQRVGGTTNSSGASGSRVLNNYIHESFQEGASIEPIEGAAEQFREVRDVLFSGNLFYHCASIPLICNREENDAGRRRFENIVIEDNMILYTGRNAWGDVGWRNISPAIWIEGKPQLANGDNIVRSNTFFVADTALFWTNCTGADYLPAFEDNKYIQLANRPFISDEQVAYYPAAIAGDAVKNLLGDETGEVYAVWHNRWNEIEW